MNKSRVGHSRVKGTGMLIISFRGVNYGICYHLGTVQDRTPIILAIKVSFRKHLHTDSVGSLYDQA